MYSGATTRRRRILISNTRSGSGRPASSEDISSLRPAADLDSEPEPTEESSSQPVEIAPSSPLPTLAAPICTSGEDSAIGPAGESLLPAQRPFDLLIPAGPPTAVEIILMSRLTGESETVRVDSPLVLIGRGSQCDLRLIHPDVSRRHACLHLLADRVLCVDLSSRTGVFWGGERRPAGWLTAERPVRIGSFELRLRTPTVSDDALTPETFFSRQTPDDVTIRGAGLRFLNQLEAAPKPVSLSRPITLIGRAEPCKLRLRDDSVSRVHSSLMLTREGVWIADLLGRGGVKVNGEYVSLARLATGDELQIGRYRMEFATDLPSITDESEDLEAAAAPGSAIASGMVSESLLLAVTETFADMQRQMSEQFRLQMELMVGLIESMRKEMNAEIRQELARLAAISEEIRDAQRQLACKPLAAAEPLEQRPAPSPATDEPRRRTGPALPPGRPSSQNGVADHALLASRLRELERERASRWLKLVGLLKGGL